MPSPRQSGQKTFETRHSKAPVLAVPHGHESLPLICVTREGETADSNAHRHKTGQLIYPQRGTTILETPNALVRLEPDRAAWIPAGMPHSVIMHRTFRYHSLYIDPPFYSNDSFSVVAIAPLLRELILDASAWQDDGVNLEQHHRKALVIIDELKDAPMSAPGIHIPEDKRIAPICRDLERDPSIDQSIEQWAKQVGSSAKSIQRAFVASTGQTFQQWRHRVRMIRALEYHARGMRLLDIAVAVGYETEGSYAQAFRKFYGHPPSLLKTRRP